MTPVASGRDKVKISAGGNEEKQGRGEPCGAGDIRGTAAVGDGGAQSRLGGMVNGVPEAMDGFEVVGTGTCRRSAYNGQDGRQSRQAKSLR